MTDEKLRDASRNADAAIQGRIARTLKGRTLQQFRETYRAIVGPPPERDSIVAQAIEKIAALAPLTPIERAALEEAIRVFRPSLASKRGKLPPLPAEMNGIFAAWSTFADAFPRIAYAVGRIDLPPTPGGTPAPEATGFLVRTDILVTNRHVVRVLERGAEQIVPGEPVVRFGQETGKVDHFPAVKVLRVVAEHPTLDLALLAIAPDEARPVLELDPTPPRIGDQIAVVGYPCQDAKRNPLFANVVFRGGYEVKQAAPGEILKTLPSLFHHDCSTQGGSSGSPVLSLSTGKVVGVHFWGGFLLRNEAVDAASLGRFVSDTVRPS